MNKSALKKFATDARRELLEKVELQARKLGITAESIQEVSIESSDAVFIEGRQLSDTERKQRNKLIARINEIGFARVMDETAYTWFNRFVALRYMEVNDYLPTKVRVLSSNSDSAEPDMMKEALSLNLDLDKEYVYDLKLNNKTDELFKYLIKMHCNDLNRYMPFMFETIEDYSEILFPEGLLGTDSFLRQMINTEVIPEEDWKKVEIIGWLYQYYISEENERVIQAKKRYKAEEIPFATQLFTPEWIVRYMVQNALGRYWMESHPEQRDLMENWEFYLENPTPEADLEEKLAPYINRELNVEDIKCFDPAMGSGHILVYMFDVLHEIYSKCGYMEREIPRLIIENNLYGLDIDDRAYQLASFSVVMKALQYNKRFLRSVERDGLTINLVSIQETNAWSDEEVAFLAGESSGEQFDKMKAFIDQFKHAKAIGSLIKLVSYDIKFQNQRLKAIEQQSGNLFELEMKDRTVVMFRNLIKQATLMELQYDVLITNPPYAGNSYVTTEVSAYLLKEYPDVKSDLFSSFIEYSFQATKENGQMGFMTPFVWMFISSYEKLRKKVLSSRSISSLIQLEYSAFDGATVPICTFTLRNYQNKIEGEYVRLSDFRGAENQPKKTVEAVQNPSVSYRYTYNQENFSKVPGNPIAYWYSEQKVKAFSDNRRLDDFGETGKGIGTGNNDRFLKLWYEVEAEKFLLLSKKSALNSKWFPYNKGGEFRKWYGNNEFVINWENDGEELKKFPNSYLRNQKDYFKPGLTWTKVTSSKFSLRYFGEGFLFDDGGCCFFATDPKLHYYILGLLNSRVFNLIGEINPTLNFQAGDIAKAPILISDESIQREVTNIVNENIHISKEDWDNIETSWDFRQHPLLSHAKGAPTIEFAFNFWGEYAKKTILST